MSSKLALFLVPNRVSEPHRRPHHSLLLWRYEWVHGKGVLGLPERPVQGGTRGFAQVDLAIHAVATQVAPRHTDRPTSGQLKPTYLLVKHPDGGYGETLLSAGERASLLPHFEIKIVPGEPLEGRVRGTTNGARRLLDTFRSALQKMPAPDGSLFQVTVNMDLDESVSSDPDFWPRIVLLPGDRLLLRGRNLEEIMRFMQVFTEFANSDYTVPEEWSKPPGGN